MITTVWPYMAIMLLAAGLFPALERARGWRVFAVLPPIVWTYLLVTALAVAGVWEATDDIRSVQRAVTGQLLPALLFLLMVNCDLRAIIALGPRVLFVFACAMASIVLAMLFCYAIFRNALPADGWKMLGALTATWTGGSANLVAVKQIVGLPENLLPPVLLADALCYSTWIVVLFSSAGLAPAFDRWTGADQRAPLPQAELQEIRPTDPGSALVWLAIALTAGLLATELGALMPTGSMFTQTSWTVLFATVLGLAVAQTSLARLPGTAPLASALLACLVAVLGSQSNFAGMSEAPLFVFVGYCALALHVLMLVGAAKAFRFDLHLCGISSLAQIGGPATVPLLAATYNKVLVPVAVLLAMLGLVLGTAVGMATAQLLSTFAPVVAP